MKSRSYDNYFNYLITITQYILNEFAIKKKNVGGLCVMYNNKIANNCSYNYFSK